MIIYYKVIFSIILMLNCYFSIGQTNSDIKDHFCDSVVSDYLLRLYPNQKENVLGNGRNFKYLSFRLPMINKFDTVKIVNFGENSTHRPSLMLILIISGNFSSEQLLLGLESIELDLAS